MSNKRDLPEMARLNDNLRGDAPAVRAPAQAPPAGGFDILRYLSAIGRHKWILIGAAVLGLGLGFTASRYFHPEYAAQGTIWIEGGDRERGNTGPIVQMQLLRSYAWVELLKSYAVLDSVVKQEKLFIVPPSPKELPAFAGFELQQRFRPGKYRLAPIGTGEGFILSTAEGAEIERVATGQPVGQKVGFQWVPPASLIRDGKGIEFSVNNPRDVARQLADDLEAVMAEDGRFLRLGLSGSHPARVASTLNSIMTRYVEVAAQLKRSKLDELTGILQEQRQYAEKNLRDSEMALEGFRVQTITLPSAQGAPVAPGIEMTRDPVFNSFFEMKVAHEDLRRDRLALDNTLQAMTSGSLQSEALTAIPAAQNSPALMSLLNELTNKRAELRALQKRYTEDHAPVRTLMTSTEQLEKVAIPAAVRQLQAQLEARERDMTSRIGSASSELREIPPRAIEEARLQRRVEIAATLHGVLRQRYEEARLAAVSSIADVRVLDEASIPFSPVKDPRKMVIAGFAGGFIGLALMLILMLDRSDRRVRYPEQVTMGMGLPILTAVPHIKGTGQNPTADGLLQLAEAFRELRFAVMQAHGSKDRLMLSLSSPESGDGKSMAAANLAIVFAEQGHRVILIDADVRRGNLHRSFGLPRTPGLTDYLLGRASIEDVVHQAEGGFSVILSGTRMQVGPELIGSPAMGDLLRDLHAQYSVVIVDTPPLSAGIDAYVLATMTENLLLVLRTGATDAQLAEAKLALLDRLPVRVLGALLNDVPRSRIYRYYSYAPGYGAEDEAMNGRQLAGITESSVAD